MSVNETEPHPFKGPALEVTQTTTNSSIMERKWSCSTNDASQHELREQELDCESLHWLWVTIFKSAASHFNFEPVGVERVVHSLFGGQQTTFVVNNVYKVSFQSAEKDFVTCVSVKMRDHPIPNPKNEILRELKSTNVMLTNAFNKIKKIQGGLAAMRTHCGMTYEEG